MLQFSPVILINFSSERWGWRCRQRNLANLSPECIRCTTPSRFSFSALQFLSFSSLLGLSPKTCFRPTCWTLLVCVRQSAWEILKNRGNETAWAGREVEASWVVADSCRLWLKQFLKSIWRHSRTRPKSHLTSLEKSCTASKERRYIKTPTFVFGWDFIICAWISSNKAASFSKQQSPKWQ